MAGKRPTIGASKPPQERHWLGFRALSPRSLTFISFLSVLVIWEVVARTLGTSKATGASILPDITTTLSAFVTYSNYWAGGLGAGDTRMGFDETLWGATLGLTYNLGAMLLRLVNGLAIGLVLGVGIGFLVSWSGLVRSVLAFPVHFLRMMPLLALIPLFAMWFRDKNTGSILFIAIAVFVLMFAATLNAYAMSHPTKANSHDRSEPVNCSYISASSFPGFFPNYEAVFFSRSDFPGTPRSPRNSLARTTVSE